MPNKTSAEGLVQLVKLGLSPHDAIVSQRNALKELRLLVRLGLLLHDAVYHEERLR